MRQILHVDLDAFFASVEQVLNPALVGKPVVVGGRPDGRGVVTSASYPARACGIKAGMPLSRAYWLCPQAVFVQGRFSEYRKVSERFMSILADFSPFIEPGGIDEAYVDVTGFESLYGPAHLTARRIRERIWDELRLTVSVGVSTCKVVSKVASDLDKPDGLVEVFPGMEGKFLSPLPVGRLPGVGPRTEAVLKRVGVTTIGGLAALPASYLHYLLGRTGEALWRLAKGEDYSPVEPPGEAKSISRSITFSDDTRESSFLLATLRYLSESVGAQLRRSGKQARVMSLRLRYADFETLSRQRHVRRPTDIDQVIFETAAELMEVLLAKGWKPVRLLGVAASDLQQCRQLSLMPSHEDRLATLDRAVDKLRSRYGYDAIQSGRTLEMRRLSEVS